MQTPHWTGRFFSIDDLWQLSAAQMRAAITMDRLADDDGHIRVPAHKIAKLAGVSRPRVSEAVAYLTARGSMVPREHGDKTPGYTLKHNEINKKTRIEIALERGEAKLTNGGIEWVNIERRSA